ncbi:hypothetical protein FB451DRAFT_1368535 [Mycena latifolia]|nr:hypothetical protein FB451DRAFT_1368535 [Mycena latifolia]
MCERGPGLHTSARMRARPTERQDKINKCPAGIRRLGRRIAEGSTPPPRNRDPAPLASAFALSPSGPTRPIGTGAAGVIEGSRFSARVLRVRGGGGRREWRARASHTLAIVLPIRAARAWMRMVERRMEGDVTANRRVPWNRFEFERFSVDGGVRGWGWRGIASRECDTQPVRLRVAFRGAVRRGAGNWNRSREGCFPLRKSAKDGLRTSSSPASSPRIGESSTSDADSGCRLADPLARRGRGRLLRPYPIRVSDVRPVARARARAGGGGLPAFGVETRARGGHGQHGRRLVRGGGALPYPGGRGSGGVEAKLRAEEGARCMTKGARALTLTIFLPAPASGREEEVGGKAERTHPSLARTIVPKRSFSFCVSTALDSGASGAGGGARSRSGSPARRPSLYCRVEGGQTHGAIIVRIGHPRSRDAGRAAGGEEAEHAGRGGHMHRNDGGGEKEKWKWKETSHARVIGPICRWGFPARLVEIQRVIDGMLLCPGPLKWQRKMELREHNILHWNFGTVPSCAWKCLASLSSRQKVSGGVII